MSKQIKQNNFTLQSEAQRLLNNALSYWLHGSILSFSSKSILHTCSYVKVHPLIKCAVAFQETGVLLPKLSPAMRESKVSKIQYAQILSLFYQLWERYLP